MKRWDEHSLVTRCAAQFTTAMATTAAVNYLSRHTDFWKTGAAAIAKATADELERRQPAGDSIAESMSRPGRVLVAVTEPTADEANDRYRQICSALSNVRGTSFTAGYRRIEVGGLTIRVKAHAQT